MITIDKETIKIASTLAKDIALQVSDERSSKFGYDMMCGLVQGDFIDRLNAWIDWYNGHLQGNTSAVDANRDGVWVPAIEFKC
jgi:hypothetical protein